MDLENSTIPQSLRNKKLKLKGEEINKQIIIKNQNIINNANNPPNAKETISSLFPSLTPEEISNVLERAEYNIEEAMNLIKELKANKKNLSKEKKKEIELKMKKGLIKRNYNTMIEQANEALKNQNKSNISQNSGTSSLTVNLSNNINTIENINKNKNNNENENSSTNPNINNNDINININSLNNNNDSDNNINSIPANNSNKNDRNYENKVESINHNNHNINVDDAKRNLINRQINYLVGKFSEMTEISQLKNLLKEIGFPENKENNDESEVNKYIEILKEKAESNKEEKKFIINQYNKHNAVCQQIKQKEEKIDELTSTLGNLIDAESEQKMREEEYKNELIEYMKYLKENNNFYNPEEGY